MMFYLHSKFHDNWISSFRGDFGTDGRTDGRSDCTARPAFAFGDAVKNYQGEVECHIGCKELCGDAFGI